VDEFDTCRVFPMFQLLLYHLNYIIFTCKTRVTAVSTICRYKSPQMVSRCMLVKVMNITPPTIDFLHYMLWFLHEYAPEPATAGIGQSSSVMLDQNSQMTATAKSVNSVSNRPPLILPSVPSHMCTLMTYWKICPIANRSAAANKYTMRR
jgi:hypothetical protein